MIQPSQEREILMLAQVLDGQARTQYLNSACRNDKALREEIEKELSKMHDGHADAIAVSRHNGHDSHRAP